MFSFGWSEIALTVVVVIIVVGPKEIPNLLRQLRHISKFIKKTSIEFKKSLNEVAKENNLQDIKKSVSEIKNIKKDLDPKNVFKDEISSINHTIKSFEEDVVDNKTKNKKTD